MSDFDAPELTTGDISRAEREGLPAGYRMRADAHYVESLSSPHTARPERPHTDGARASLRDGFTAASPRSAHDRHLFQQLSEDMATIESAVAMVTSEASPLARRVGLDLIKAQSARAAWLLRAHALATDPATETSLRPKPVGAILVQLRDRLAPECRLVGVGLDVAVDDPTIVTTEEATLRLGITGAVLALLGLIGQWGQADGAAIRVNPVVHEGQLKAVEVSQDAVPVSAATRDRFFDAGWIERPGGWLAATGAATARTAAARLGGDAALTAGPRAGCTIQLRLL